MTATNTISELALSDATFEENLKSYSDMFISLGRKASTVSTNGRFLKNIARMMDDKDPYLWTEEDVQSFILTDKWSEWSPATQRTAKAVLKSYWEILGRVDLVPPHLVYFWKARTVYGGGSNDRDRLKARCPTASEVEHVLDVAEDVILTHDSDVVVYRHMALYLVAAYGLRSIGVAHMRVCDVDIEARIVHIEMSKGDKSRDVHMDIPISEEMWSRFMDARSSIVARLRAGTDKCHVITNLDSLSGRASPLFFIRENGVTGEPATPRAIGGMVARLASAILERRVNAHSFRHAKVFYLLEVRKIVPHRVMEYMGHSNIQQTLDYSYTGIEEQRAAFDQPTTNAPPLPSGVATSDPAPAPVGEVDAAVGALTALYSAGKLSTGQFADAVAALGK